MKSPYVCTEAFNHSVIPFKLQLQERLFWCWASVTAGIANYYLPNKIWHQKDIVISIKERLALSNSQSITLGQVHNLDEPLKLVNVFRDKRNGPININEIKRELTNGHPICVRIGWKEGGGHFVVIHGISSVSNTHYLHVVDPFFGSSIQNLSHFANNYRNNGQWTHTYFTKKPTMIELPEITVNQQGAVKQFRPILFANDHEQYTNDFQITLPHKVYTISADSRLLEPILKKSFCGTRVIEIDDSGKAIAIYTLDETPKVIEAYVDEEYLGAYIKAIDKSSELLSNHSGPAEIRLLNIPECYCEAFWVKYDDQEAFIPIRCSEYLTPSESYNKLSFFTHIKKQVKEQKKSC